MELFCDRCPKSCENFLALAATDYYDNCVFVRNIKGFMVQTGDPSNTVGRASGEVSSTTRSG